MNILFTQLKHISNSCEEYSRNRFNLQDYKMKVSDLNNFSKEILNSYFIFLQFMNKCACLIYLF